ncbi:MAG: hypothetical protein P4L31_07310 [Candidatus Babeliales bacterium]|nr:hypothetical protein [Candidatus Babeliales bacterium]
MKKSTIQLFVIIAIVICCKLANAQTKIKRDSIKFDTTEVGTIYRNSGIIQQQLHLLHIDGILRDKLDSVYKVSIDIIESKFRKPQPQKPGKKP